MKEIPPKINFELAASSPPWKGRTRLVFKDLAKGNIQSVLIRPALMVVVWFHASLEVSVSTGESQQIIHVSRDFPLQTIYFLGYPHD